MEINLALPLAYLAAPRVAMSRTLFALLRLYEIQIFLFEKET